MLTDFISIVAPLLERLIPFVSGGAMVFIGGVLLRKTRKLSQADRDLRGDEMLVSTAIEEVQGDAPKITYLRVSVQQELERLTEAYDRSGKFRKYLGSVYLLAGFASIAITGTNASISGLVDTVKFSFAVNIVGEIASGFLIFGGFESKGAATYQLASLIRLELGQFCAQSNEYYQQAETERWRLFTHAVETLLLKAILPEAQGKRKEDGKQDSEMQSEVVRDEVVD